MIWKSEKLYWRFPYWVHCVYNTPPLLHHHHVWHTPPLLHHQYLFIYYFKHDGLIKVNVLIAPCSASDCRQGCCSSDTFYLCNLGDPWLATTSTPGPNMIMFGEIHFGRPPADPHFDPPSPGPKIKIGPNKLEIQNQRKKCFPTIYNMTMFGEILFGRPPGDPHFDPLSRAQKSKLGQTKKYPLGIILKMPET